MMERRLLLLLVLLGSLQFFCLPFAASQSFIGINYGDVADNLPPPSATARLLQSTSITKVRLYGTDQAVVSALAGTGIAVLLGASNGDIPSLASSVSAASAWVSAHVPAASSPTVSAVSVGNEVLTAGDAALSSQIVPAMQNLYAALPPNSSIKVSTVNSMAVLSQSDPPSAGAFHPDLAASLDPLLAFLSKTGSPFMINPYPYFAYSSDTRPETLAFCLFQPNAGRPDAGSKLTYMNMFDAQLDAIRAALDARGYKDVEIVVAETGWPHKGDAGEAGASVENARAYVANLVAHLRSLAGTPRVPGKSVETYLFAMYDEDLKPGPTSERSFGLFQTDLKEIYPTGLLGNASPNAGPTMAPSASASPSPLPTPALLAPPPAQTSPAPVQQPQVTPVQVTPAQAGAAAASPSAGCAPGTAERGRANGAQPAGGCSLAGSAASAGSSRAASVVCVLVALSQLVLRLLT